jgi:formiminoglutamase
MVSDLALFFNALPEELAADAASYSDLYYAAEIYTHSFPRVQAESIVLIGLPDLDSDEEDGAWTVADAFRKQFYGLKRTARNVQLYDLGNMRPAETPAQTLERIGVLCAKVMDGGAVPVLIGGNRELMVGHFRAALDTEGDMNLANIDASMDLDHEDGVLHRIVTLRNELPTYFCQIAYQSYLVDPMGLSVLDRLNFDALRLGQIHENFRVAEPFIRDADMLFFNLSAMRNTAFVHAPGPRPFGLNGEQACQLCWYGGISARLKSIGFYNIDNAASTHAADMATLAIMVWHFIEGFSYRTPEQPLDERSCDRHIVALSGYEDLLFFRSRSTDRWWMLVPDKSGKRESGYLLPCLYEEYMLAVNGQLPDRWVRTFGRIN